MNTTATEVEVDFDSETQNDGSDMLSVDQLALIAGGQCITNSI